MGLISKIANSKLGKGGSIATGIGTVFVPTYEMLNPPAVYAQQTPDVRLEKIIQIAKDYDLKRLEQIGVRGIDYDLKRAEKIVERAKELVDKVGNLPDPKELSYVQREDPELWIYKFAGELRFSSSSVPSEHATKHQIGGYLHPEDLQTAVNILYNAAQHKFGRQLGVIAEQNPQLRSLVNTYNEIYTRK